MSALTLPIIDGLTIAKRNAIKIKRSPEQLGAAIALPVVLILLFIIFIREISGRAAER